MYTYMYICIHHVYVTTLVPVPEKWSEELKVCKRNAKEIATVLLFPTLLLKFYRGGGKGTWRFTKWSFVKTCCSCTHSNNVRTTGGTAAAAAGLEELAGTVTLITAADFKPKRWPKVEDDTGKPQHFTLALWAARKGRWRTNSWWACRAIKTRTVRGGSFTFFGAVTVGVVVVVVVVVVVIFLLLEQRKLRATALVPTVKQIGGEVLAVDAKWNLPRAVSAVKIVLESLGERMGQFSVNCVCSLSRACSLRLRLDDMFSNLTVTSPWGEGGVEIQASASQAGNRELSCQGWAGVA